jgi:hypothetical protein
MTSFQVKVLQKKFTLLHAHFSKIVLKYSSEVHLLRYLTPLQIVYMFIVKIMKYPIYMSLSYNSPDFQYKADFGSGDFQYTCPRASCEQRACA